MIDINKLTDTTILEDEIFRRVFNERDDVKRAKIIIALQSKARSFGKKGEFDILLKAHERSVEKQLIQQKQSPKHQDFPTMTEFQGKHVQMLSGDWICNENGVRAMGALGQEIIACYHPILPITRYINIESGKEKIKIAYKKKNKWNDITVDKGVIASSNRIVQLAEHGISVTSESSRALVRYLSDIENININEIPVRNSTGKLGWIKKEFVPFSKEYEFDAETSYREAYESIGEVGCEEKWMDLVKEIRKSGKFEPKISIAASLASVLIKPLNALPFIVNIGGPTGKGKTVSMMVAVSCWANPAENRYMTDCKSTVTAIELNLDFLNNMPMFLDDMSQIKEKYSGDFTGLVYMLCSGKGKDRANKDLSLKERTTWKNIILTNYEYSLVTETMQGGAINRIIDVEIEDDEPIFNSTSGNKVVEVVANNYGFAGRKFLEIIKEIGLEKIKEMQEEAYDAIVEKSKKIGCEKEDKQMLPMSILLTADRIATKHIFKDGEYLDFDMCVSFLKDKGEVSENERAYQFVQSEISININKFKPNDEGEYKGEAWGKFEDGHIIIANNAFEFICKKGGFSSQSFLKWAKRKELLDCTGDRLKKQKRIGGARSYCVCLKLPEGYDSDLDVDENGFVKLDKDMQEQLPFDFK